MAEKLSNTPRRESNKQEIKKQSPETDKADVDKKARSSYQISAKNKINSVKSLIRSHKILSIVIAYFLLSIVALSVLNWDIHRYDSLEQYDLKNLNIKDACEKARSAGWRVERVVSREGDDKTDCYNEGILVTDYYYWNYSGTVTIYFGEKKTEEQKKAECESVGNWYRNGACKSQEAWENDYAWQNAHAACKKYGSSGYAKTLTDCYIGDNYVGMVDGQPANNGASESVESQQESNMDVQPKADIQSNNDDDPYQIPESEIWTAIAACKRVIKQLYGLKVKDTEFFNGYWYGEDYVWLLAFRGTTYNSVTCRYNWKTGYATSSYINW